MSKTKVTLLPLLCTGIFFEPNEISEKASTTKIHAKLLKIVLLKSENFNDFNKTERSFFPEAKTDFVNFFNLTKVNKSAGKTTSAKRR